MGRHSDDVCAAARGLAAVAALAVAFWGCGSSSTRGLFSSASGGKTHTGGSPGTGGTNASGGSSGANAGTGGATTGGAGGAAGSGGSGPDAGPKYTLDDVCQLMGPKICQERVSCCNQAGFGFSQSGCEQAWNKVCNADVTAVQAGNEVFHPAHIDDCLSALNTMYAQCWVGGAQYAPFLHVAILCGTIFDGNVPAGHPCERDGQCSASSDPNTLVNCDTTTHTCTDKHIFQSGEKCTVSNQEFDICDSGLYCKTSLISRTGTCAKSTAPGSPCDWTNVYDLECGLGYYCKTGVASGTCTKAQTSGTCTNSLQCQSLSCSQLHCAPVSPVVTHSECTG